jgi:hypothetical protein
MYSQAYISYWDPVRPVASVALCDRWVLKREHREAERHWTTLSGQCGKGVGLGCAVESSAISGFDRGRRPQVAGTLPADFQLNAQELLASAQ